MHGHTAVLYGVSRLGSKVMLDLYFGVLVSMKDLWLITHSFVCMGWVVVGRGVFVLWLSLNGAFFWFWGPTEGGSCGDEYADRRGRDRG